MEHRDGMARSLLRPYRLTARFLKHALLELSLQPRICNDKRPCRLESFWNNAKSLVHSATVTCRRGMLLERIGLYATVDSSRSVKVAQP
jgi:hypothetical protein